ncbi:MAG: NfeD family protein [Cyclobacteriaceae bacterium]
MEWIIVSGLILAGLLLLVVEILFVPGTTLVGLLGFILVLTGGTLSFKYFGPETGWLTVGGSSILSALALYASFKSKLWSKFSLKSSMTGLAVENLDDKLQAGQEGKALSSLRPSGKAEFGNIVCEVRTRGGFADAGSRLKISEVSGSVIIVEPIN